MADTYTKDKRYRITHYITKDFASYFETDTRWEWQVTDTKTNKVLATFTESEFSNSSGTQETGVKNVRFSEDNKKAIAEYYDGTTETINLTTGKTTSQPKPPNQ